MSKYVAHIPLKGIEKIQIYINQGKKTLAQIQADIGADYIMNGGFYDGNHAVCHLMADGKVYANDATYHAPGYAWDSGEDIAMAMQPGGQKRNHITGCQLIVDGIAQKKLYYNGDVGDKRARTAMGVKDGCLMLYVSKDGTGDAKTPEALRDELHGMGWDSAVMLDGGGSSQCDFQGQKITSARRVHNLILVYLKKKGATPVDGITQDVMKNNPCYTNGKTIAPKGIMVHSTATPGAMAGKIRNQWNSPAAQVAVHAILDDTTTFQTLPWTARAWHCGASANNTHISFEICEPQECRLLPIEWAALKRGSTGWAVKQLQLELQARGYDPEGLDGSFGPGCEAALRACQTSLGLTVDGSCGPATRAALAARTGSYLAYNPQDTQGYFNAVWARAVALCVTLCKAYGLNPMVDIICHSEGHALGIASNHADVMHWFPRHGKSMDDFRADVQAAMGGASNLDMAVDKLAGKGIITDPDYWKGGDYSTANVQALILKMAAGI